MSDEMEVLSSGQTNGCNSLNTDCEMELDLESLSKDNPEHQKTNRTSDLAAADPPDSKANVFFPNKNPLKLQFSDHTLTGSVSKKSAKPTEDNAGADLNKAELADIEPFQRELSTPANPFQKPSVCRTHSLGAADNSPFTIRRRPEKLRLSNQLQSPSAFRRRKLCIQSPFRGDLFDDSDENVLKRCNSAPMLNEMNDTDARVMWHHSSMTPGSIRARRFSATVLSVHASPTAGTAKSTSRLHQLKKEESLEGIQHKETAHEREVQTSIQMYHTCGELSLSDSHESLNGLLSGSGDGPVTRPPVSSSSATEVPRSPLPSTNSVNVPGINKQSSTRAIDFSAPGASAGIPAPIHAHHPGGGGIPSPLTISPSSCIQSLSPLPPSPTRGLGLSSTGKQCFLPSMQAPVPVRMGPGSLSPSPSPTRRTFVTRRRSQSPCVMKPSALGPIKRKYDSDSEGGCSPKRMFIPGSHMSGVQAMNPHGDSLNPYPVVTPFFHRGPIHRSHSLSSSSVDSDVNVSPSPPQNGVNVGFLPSNNALGMNPHLRDSNNGSPFQSPLNNNPFLMTGNTHLELGRCSSPASSTCSSSSLEGLRDLQPFSQSHLNNSSHTATNGITGPMIMKSVIKDQQSSIATATSAANVSL